MLMQVTAEDGYRFWSFCCHPVKLSGLHKLYKNLLFNWSDKSSQIALSNFLANSYHWLPLQPAAGLKVHWLYYCPKTLGDALWSLKEVFNSQKKKKPLSLSRWNFEIGGFPWEEQQKAFICLWRSCELPKLSHITSPLFVKEFKPLHT